MSANTSVSPLPLVTMPHLHSLSLEGSHNDLGLSSVKKDAVGSALPQGLVKPDRFYVDIMSSGWVERNI